MYWICAKTASNGGLYLIPTASLAITESGYYIFDTLLFLVCELNWRGLRPRTSEVLGVENATHGSGLAVSQHRIFWRYRGSSSDALRRLLLVYSEKLPPIIRKREWEIAFHYPEPIGDIRLLLRANHGSDIFIHSEVFTHNYYRLGLSSTPKTILDLGANIGLTAIYFHRCFPDAALACVEPMPQNLSVLERNLGLNDVGATVFRGAVDVADGRTSMEIASKDYGHRIKSQAKSTALHIQVTSFSIPTLLNTLGWE